MVTQRRRGSKGKNDADHLSSLRDISTSLRCDHGGSVKLLIIAGLYNSGVWSGQWLLSLRIIRKQMPPSRNVTKLLAEQNGENRQK